MKVLVCILAACLLVTAVENPDVVITGEISDSQCAFNVHSNGSHTDVIRAGRHRGANSETMHTGARDWAANMY